MFFSENTSHEGVIPNPRALRISYFSHSSESSVMSTLRTRGFAVAAVMCRRMSPTRPSSYLRRVSAAAFRASNAETIIRFSNKPTWLGHPKPRLCCRAARPNNKVNVVWKNYLTRSHTVSCRAMELSGLFNDESILRIPVLRPRFVGVPTKLFETPPTPLMRHSALGRGRELYMVFVQHCPDHPALLLLQQVATCWQSVDTFLRDVARIRPSSNVRGHSLVSLQGKAMAPP